MSKEAKEAEEVIKGLMKEFAILEQACADAQIAAVRDAQRWENKNDG